jgi:hypothetical protein
MKANVLLLENNREEHSRRPHVGDRCELEHKGGGVTAARYFMRTDAKWAMREIIH